MKFAKELEEDLVPEWRVKYLNYKAGKKYVKSVARAIRKANATPSIRRRSGEVPPLHPTPSFLSPRRVVFDNGQGEGAVGSQAGLTPAASGAGQRRPSPSGARSSSVPPAGPVAGSSAAKPIPARRGAQGPGEKHRLTDSPGSEMRYGSFVVTPPLAGSPLIPQTPGHHPHFELPAPAINYGAGTNNVGGSPAADVYVSKKPSRSQLFGALQRSFSASGPFAFSSAQQHRQQEPQPGPHHALTFAYGGGAELAHETSNANDTPQRRLRRLFSSPSPGLIRKQSRAAQQISMALQAQDEVRQREQEFFAFLDSELSKVDVFYRLKENQAGQRLAMLREQLHEMRNRRGSEIEALRRKKREEAKEEEEDRQGENDAALENGESSTMTYGNGTGSRKSSRHRSGNRHSVNGLEAKKWIEPVKSKLFGPHPGPNSKALQEMARNATTPRLRANTSGNEGGAATDRRDYTRRPPAHDVPYRTAKRKLKLALQEFYRGLELLKSYALLNRTAFRKLNKKYDKAVNAHPPYAYMNRVVNEAYFVKSTLLDEHVAAVEDLYARYFERGNHKIAAGKLRSLTGKRRPGDESASAFRSGVLIGLGAVFAVQGAAAGVRRLLGDGDAVVRGQTSYLLQIYGGYFLMLYLFVLFCLDCRLWTATKVNYHFIFEFDPRSQLDWRQLSTFPSFFLLVFGLFLWLNFSGLGDPRMFLYYPVLMIGVTVLVLFCPAPVFFYRSRRWFLYSHWRLLLAGIYPVEFRDFFFGDMYCSLTYAMCNVELFFCLYYRYWEDPSQCNSSHSRLLGFFSALPPIWRGLQCIRRYWDTKNVFPHLVNCGKYTATILAAVCLSVYRIHNTQANLALFITFSSINAVYCSFWDLFMDFSLLQPSAHNFLLRDIIALKRRWVYYAAMVLDPVLRFSWVFYAIFTHNTEHSTVVSFLVALAEITRRGMWTIFRVENEHCANVAQYKASRDVPLPYQMETFGTTPAVADALLAPVVGANAGVGGVGGIGGGGARRATVGTADEHEAATAEAAAALLDLDADTVAHATGVDVSGGLGPAPPTASSASPAAAEEGRAGTAASTPTPAPSVPDLPAGSVIRRRLTRADSLIGGISRVMAEAHKQDFEKKRRPAPPVPAASTVVEDDEDEDEDDDDDGVCFSHDEAEDEDGDLSDGGGDHGGLLSPMAPARGGGSRASAGPSSSPSLSPSPSRGAQVGASGGDGGGHGHALGARRSVQFRDDDDAAGPSTGLSSRGTDHDHAAGVETRGPLDEERDELR